MLVDELTSGVKSDIAVKIYGENLDVLNEPGSKIIGIARELEGTNNLLMEYIYVQPYLSIIIDRESVAAYSINVNDVQQIIETGIGGNVVGRVFEEQRQFDIVARFPDDLRDRFEKIRNIPLKIGSGGTVPLKQLSKIEPQEGPREIIRENGWGRFIVGINIQNIDVGTYVANLKKAIKDNLTIPPGYFISYGGSFENQERAMNHLYVVVPISLLIILGLLYIRFGKWRYTILIFANLPFALSGGNLILWLRGMYLSVSASIGFIALFGVAVLNGIVLVEHMNELRRQGSDVHEAAVQGATDRLRPVLMTALVASLGFVPMAFNTGPDSEVQRPLAPVVVGGLITSTMMTLFILPAIYKWMGKKRPCPPPSS